MHQMTTAFLSRFAARRLMAILLVAFLSMLVAPSASAQGTSGQLPDPISSQELARWLNRYISPSPAQWTAIDAAHERYKEEFGRLREGEIEKFLQQTRQMQGQMPDRATMKSFVETWQRLNQRIRSLDTRFFDEVQSAVEEAQMQRMARVRTARERSVSGGSMTAGMAGGRPADLAEVVEALELDPSKFFALDPVLVSYEQQIAKRLTELTEAGMSMMSDLVERLSAAGFGDVNNEELMKDPEKLKAFMEAMQSAFKESGEKTRQKTAEISKFNHASRRQLAALLTEEDALRFRREFVTRTYPGVGSQAETERLLDAALRIRSLDEAQRAALTQLRSTWRGDDEKIETEQIAQEDEQAREQSPFDFSGEQMGERTEARQALREKRTKLATAALDQAKSIVGPELAERLDALARGASEDGEIFGAGAAQAAEVPAPEAVTGGMAERASGEDRFLPAQLTPADIADWSRRLGLDDGRKAILETLHGDYLERWAATVSPKAAEIREAQQRAWSNRGEDDEPRMNPAEIEAAYKARDAALAEIQAVESRFFDEVKAAAIEPQQAPVVDALALGRSTQITGEAFLGSFNESRESEVDVVGVVADVLGDDRFAEVAVPVLLERGPALRNASREVLRAILESQREMETFGARMQASGRDGAMDAVVEAQQQMEKLTKSTAEANEKRREAVRGLLDAVAERLEPEEAQQLRRAYAQEAFPRVYRDRRSAAPLIERAQGLAELTPAQQEQIAQLSAEYEAAYEEFCERLVAIARESRGFAGMDPAGWQEWQDRRNQMDRIRFERNELSSRMVRQLATVLGEGLAAKVPGIGQYGKEADRTPNPFEE
jgi:hypothetical protein